MYERVWLVLAIISLLIWIYLLAFRGQFWRSNCFIETNFQEIANRKLKRYPSVCGVIPARNEANLISTAVRSLLNQNYPGIFSLILVDDRSTDGTAKIAQETAKQLKKEQQLEILFAKPLPASWTGKLWALDQGINSVLQKPSPPDYFLLTDADIEHDKANLHQLVMKAQTENLNLVSLMVLLRCQSFWEKLLIPAFVFFFQKLYPFPWVNNPQNSTAAAAGGCILIKRQVLESIGGLQAIRQALIDDCALAQIVKSTAPSKPMPIWLGLTTLTSSLRPYPSLRSIWEMVTRTAFTQLNYSVWLLSGTILAMTFIYLIPPLALIIGAWLGNSAIALFGLITWILMAIAYRPTSKLYNLSFLWTFCLPAIAFLYTLMTIHSAIRHWQGRGGEWKGRVYPQT
jgi:hopene-associated glycosyltransferase HpnB